jgi:hypothetical protein
MVELIAAIRSYAGWLYALLLLLMLRELHLLWRAGRERRLALFGMERDAATGRTVRALVTVLLLCIVAIGIYTVSTVIAPVLPEVSRREAQEAPILQTPPQVAWPTPSPTPPPTPTRRPARIVTPTPTPR